MVALTRAKRSATGAGARTKPTRSPPHSTLSSDPTTATAASPHQAATGGTAPAPGRGVPGPGQVGEGGVLHQRERGRR